MSYTAVILLLVSTLALILSTQGAPQKRREHYRNMAMQRRNNSPQLSGNQDMIENESRRFELEEFDLLETPLSSRSLPESEQENDVSGESSVHSVHRSGHKAAGHRSRGTGRGRHARRHNKQQPKTQHARAAGAFFFHQAWPTG